MQEHIIGTKAREACEALVMARYGPFVTAEPGCRHSATSATEPPHNHPHDPSYTTDPTQRLITCNWNDQTNQTMYGDNERDASHIDWVAH